MTGARLVLTQARFDVRVVVRNGEQLLLTVLIPLALLLVLTLSTFISLDVPTGVARVDAALAGVLTVAVLSSAFTSLAISVGFDRRSGALLMLATTPLSRTSILAARSLATLAIVVVQSLVLALAASLLGWRPSLSALGALGFVILGSLAFGALGFALGGALRAEATLAVANGIFLVLLFVGGTAVPASALPGPLAAFVGALPSAALGDALRSLLAGGPGSLLMDAAILVGWGVVGALIAARTFRWD